MTNVSLYQLSLTPLEKALPKLLEKILEAGKRAIVLNEQEERLSLLDAALWTYNPRSFLPHGTKKDGLAEHQPIWLTTHYENPNDAGIIVLTDGFKTPDITSFERCFDIFESSDKTGIKWAKKRIASYEAEGNIVIYWQQTDQKSWQKNTNFSNNEQ